MFQPARVTRRPIRWLFRTARGTFQAMNVKLHLTFGLYCTLTFLPVTDDVKLGAVTIKGQSIGVATKSVGFDGVDGILGIGPVDLTLGTLSPDTSSSIPTVTDVCSIFLSRVIASNAVLCTEPQVTRLDSCQFSRSIICSYHRVKRD